MEITVPPLRMRTHGIPFALRQAAKGDDIDNKKAQVEPKGKAGENDKKSKVWAEDDNKKFTEGKKGGKGKKGGNWAEYGQNISHTKHIN